MQKCRFQNMGNLTLQNLIEEALKIKVSLVFTAKDLQKYFNLL